MAHRSSSVNFTIGFDNTTTNPAPKSEFCSPYPETTFGTVQSSVPYIVNAALNVLLAFTTTLANLLVFRAICRTSSIRLPSKLLLCTLVLTDLGAGSIVTPQFAVFLFMKAITSRTVDCFLVRSFIFTASLFNCVSLFTLTAISLDRYTALFSHLKYQEIATTRRVCAFLSFIWLFSLFYASTWLWNLKLGQVIIMTAIFICFFVISVAYIKIYRRLRSHHGPQVQPQAYEEAQQQAGSTLNIAKYQRTASAMLCIYAIFSICCIPFFWAQLIIAAFKCTVLAQCIYEFSYTFVLLNSCLNPFVYCLRLPEIRAEVLKQLRNVCTVVKSPQQETHRGLKS